MISLGGLRGATTLHFEMLHNILRTPMEFYDTTPKGRMLARFSNDLNALDYSLIFNIKQWIPNVIRVCLIIFCVLVCFIFLNNQCWPKMLIKNIFCMCGRVAGNLFLFFMFKYTHNGDFWCWELTGNWHHRKIADLAPRRNLLVPFKKIIGKISNFLPLYQKLFSNNGRISLGI
jgi:ABC-type multidrug transport system fused ATPase/permease subunit